MISNLKQQEFLYPKNLGFCVGYARCDVSTRIPKKLANLAFVKYFLRQLFISRARKHAFSLAEVLIALAIIGIVAALTIPALIQNHNAKAWATAQKLFTNKIEVAMRVLNKQEKLTNNKNKLNFLNQFNKNINITKVCTSDKVSECFAKEIYWNDITKPLSIEYGAKITLSDDTVLDDVVGVQFANGITALMAYMKDRCKQDSYNNTFGATNSCLAVVYDVSGAKKPNRYVNTQNKSSDIAAINVKQLNGVVGCVVKLSDADGKEFCISQILGPQNGGYSYLSPADCATAKSNGEINVRYGSSKNDYYAGAVYACGGKKTNLPNEGQLLALAKYLYGTNNIASSGTVSGLSYKDDRAEPFLAASPGATAATPWFHIWADTEKSSGYAYLRVFDADRTSWNNYNRDNDGRLAVCLGE